MRKILIIFALVLTYSNVDAQESIPLIYDKAFSVDIGYTAVIKERKVGLMNPDGKFVTKMEYDNILPNYEGFLCVAKNGKYGFINLKGEEIIPCIYDEPSNFSEGAASVKKDGLWGILKKDGQMLLPCESKYRIGPFKDGYASITEGFFEELKHIDHNGRIIPDSLFFDPNKPLPRQVENGMAYLDKKGNRVIPQTFAYAEEFKEGLAWVRTDRTWGFINLQGKMVAERYMNRVPLGSKDMAYNGFTIVIRDNKYGLINSEGRLIIPCRYESLEWYHRINEGLLQFTQTDKNGKRHSGIINTKGKIQLAAECDYIEYDESFDVYLSIKSRENKNSIIKVFDGKGKVLFQSDDFRFIRFASAPNTFIIVNSDGKTGLIDVEGNILIPFEYDSIVSTNRYRSYVHSELPYNNNAPLILCKDDKYAVVSAYGKPL